LKATPVLGGARLGNYDIVAPGAGGTGDNRHVIPLPGIRHADHRLPGVAPRQHRRGGVGVRARAAGEPEAGGSAPRALRAAGRRNRKPRTPRRDRTQADARDLGLLGAGRHEAVLGAGRRLSADAYFVRLKQGARVAIAG